MSIAAATALSPQITLAANQHASVRKTAEEFKGVFLNVMMSNMFAGLETDGPFGGGQAEETYRSLFVEEIANEIARTGGVGIADALMRDLIAQQETAQ